MLNNINASYSFKDFLKGLFRLIKLLKNIDMKTFFTLKVLLIISGIMPVLFVSFFKKFVDSGIAYMNHEISLQHVLIIFAILIVIRLANNFSEIFANWLSLRQNMQINGTMNKILVEKTSTIPLELFENNNLYNQIKLANNAVNRHLSQISSSLPTIITMLISTIYLLTYLGRVSIAFPLLLLLSSIPITLLDKENQSPVIQVKSVSYTYYGSQKYALKDINLELKNNECIALVGANGSGKTTLTKLILGLYKPTEGNIYINGVNIKDKDYHDKSAVFQDYMKYELSAKENIGFGNIMYLDNLEMIKKFAKKSGADEFIETFSDKYNTILGKSFDNNGVDVSIGQWQKLAIGRAYMRDAGILILDEPTAALDPRAEAEIYRQFKEMAEGKLVIMISHRLGSAKIADRIVVIDEGVIIEQGTHEELMTLKGQYEKMYNAQAQWYN